MEPEQENIERYTYDNVNFSLFSTPS